MFDSIKQLINMYVCWMQLESMLSVRSGGYLSQLPTSRSTS